VSGERAPRFLAVATAAMALLALLPWVMGGAVPTLRPPAPSETLPRLAALPPYSDFAEITARPLFSPTRRPDAASIPIGIEARYRLLGIVIAGTARHALLAPVAGGAALELAEGGSVEGWTVQKIERDRVLLVSPAGAKASLSVQAPAR
jgi:hypothetical protein